ncbi:MAG: 16S rRNA (cytosine(1402)-N(4))-methyltransferase RsmH [Candidatus Krumholzibacteriota bacterium]|nr:16S rRNA (cytosine(1402)-N(4))-methyltransferase RsmH [Candidatus Krumholzibacteriota bacterium]
MRHIPVMAEEVVRLLAPKAGGRYADATLGGGGHAARILDAAPRSTLVGIDRDPAALAAAGERLAAYGDRVRIEQGNFRDLARLAGTGPLDGLLVDLGLSSIQLDDPLRGFSYRSDGPLSMTMGADGRSAAGMIAEAPEREIRSVLRRFGEETRAASIARAIVAARNEAPIETAGKLRAVVEAAVPAHRAVKTLSRVFQALRIWANDELAALEELLPVGLDLLSTGGRIVVISYHSLEDRIVKRFFRREERGCICPPDFPECRCGRLPTLEVLTRRPLRPTAEEIERNARARSARLRAAERI